MRALRQQQTTAWILVCFHFADSFIPGLKFRYKSIYEDRIVSYLGLVSTSTVLPSLLHYQIEKNKQLYQPRKIPSFFSSSSLGLWVFWVVTRTQADPVSVNLASQRPSVQPQIDAKIPDTFHLLSEPSKNDYWLLWGLTDCYSLKRGTQKQPQTQG